MSGRGARAKRIAANDEPDKRVRNFLGTAMQKSPQASLSVPWQSTGVPGRSSWVTVALADVVHAQVVSERAASVGVGGPGLSSGLTSTTTAVLCPADAKRLTSPPVSPGVQDSCYQSTTSDLLTARSFTVASDDISKQDDQSHARLESHIRLPSGVNHQDNGTPVLVRPG